MNPSFAIVDWEDDTSSVISLKAITKPRIEFEEYFPGGPSPWSEDPSHGRLYNCMIVKIGGSKNLLEKKLDQLIQSRNEDTETISSQRTESRVNSSPPKQTSTSIPTTKPKKRPAQRKFKVYTSNPDKQGDLARCKSAIHSKITSTISKFKAQYGEPVKEDASSEANFKSPEFCASDTDSDSD